MSDAASAGYFSAVELAPKDRPTRLDLVSVPGAAAAPPAMLKLAGDIQVTARLVSILFAHDRRRRDDFLQQLHLTADTGLRGPGFSVANGSQNLAEVRDDIAAAFVSIRSHYYWRYFWAMVLLGVPTFALGAAAYLAVLARAGALHLGTGLGAYLAALPVPDLAHGYPAWAVLAIALFWIPAGVTLGIFVEFMLRVDDQVPFDKLIAINPGRWNVLQRLINVVFLAYCLALAMALSIFQIGVLTVLLNDFATTKPYLAALVGFVTALGTSYVRDIIYRVRPEVRTT